MMEKVKIILENITYRELIDYILEDLPPAMPLRDAIKEIGISWGSYMNLKHGRTPSVNLIRKLKGYLSGMGLNIEKADKGKVSIVKSVTEENNISIGTVGQSQKIDYLLERIIALEKENKTLLEFIKKNG